jgi:hypothetical protein
MIKVRTACRVDAFPAGSKATVNIGKVALDSEQPCPQTRVHSTKHSQTTPTKRSIRRTHVLIGEGVAKSAIGSGLVERPAHRLKQCL